MWVATDATGMEGQRLTRSLRFLPIRPAELVLGLGLPLAGMLATAALLLGPAATAVLARASEASSGRAAMAVVLVVVPAGRPGRC